MFRVVLDTDVIVAAFRSTKGASSALIYAAGAGYVDILATVALMLEYEAVCSRAVHVNAAHGGAEGLRIHLDSLAELIEPVRNNFVWRPQLNDRDDELVLEAAINGRADALVTFNVKDFRSVAGKFGIEVVNPADILRRLRP